MRSAFRRGSQFACTPSSTTRRSHPILLLIYSTFTNFKTTTTINQHHFLSLPFIATSSSCLSSISSSSSSRRLMASNNDDVASYGFERPEMFTSSVANTVDPYDRHVFLCYKSYEAWPSKVEDSDSDPLPKLFNSVLKARKDDIPLKTRLTVCGTNSGIDCSNGDVLIFPEMVKYRGLKESDVEAFVDDVLVNGKPWASGVPENLSGAYVFVCCHASRDKRCGYCGPILIEKFKEQIAARDLNEKIFVIACSHVGGHKYAGNIIIFGTNVEGKVIGDWYGYVTPTDVPDLLDAHIGMGETIEKLWRGQMGLKVEAAEKKENVPEKVQNTETEDKQKSNIGCCQGASAVSCCRDGSSAANGDVGDEKVKKTSDKPCKNSGACLSAWMGKWEQSDVLMAAGVVGAVVTVAVAYSFFKSSA